MQNRILTFILVALMSMSVGSILQPLSLLQALAQQGQQPNCQTFPETGQTVCGRFLAYWQTHGGLAQQGFPISGEFQEQSDLNGHTYTVQYFERAVFEYHPENQPPYDVLLSLLGLFQYQQKYSDGTPHQLPSHDANRQLFVETGKTVGGVFLDYWNAHGGLAQQGYPISEEFNEVSDLDGKSYTVQYFERAVFEWHPENAGTPYEVLLSQLGKFQYNAKYVSRPVFPPTATQGCWTNYTNSVGGTFSRLRAIDAVADNDVWAVGEVGTGYGDAFHVETLTIHWDGLDWRRVPSPNKADTSKPSDPYLNGLVGVSGTSANDVWAIGRNLVLHWDGRVWSDMAYPVSYLADGWLTGVAALSPTDVWIVGFVGSTQSSAGFLISHWDGKSWTRIWDVNFSGVVGRDTARGGGLAAIKAFSPNDIWAVGSGSTANSPARPLAIHWDGVRWSGATLFEPRDNFVALNGLGGTSSQDLWAVGQRRGIGGEGYGPYVFTAHWDGSAWSAVDAPDPIDFKNSGGTLYGVSALGKDDAWAVGSAMPEADTFSFLLHWDGQRWAVVRTPLARKDDLASALSGVTGVHGALWAVGSEDPNGVGDHASIVHRAANCVDPPP